MWHCSLHEASVQCTKQLSLRNHEVTAAHCKQHMLLGLGHRLVTITEMDTVILLVLPSMSLYNQILCLNAAVLLSRPEQQGPTSSDPTHARPWRGLARTPRLSSKVAAGSLAGFCQGWISPGYLLNISVAILPHFPWVRSWCFYKQINT